MVSALCRVLHTLHLCCMLHALCQESHDFCCVPHALCHVLHGFCCVLHVLCGVHYILQHCVLLWSLPGLNLNIQFMKNLSLVMYDNDLLFYLKLNLNIPSVFLAAISGHLLGRKQSLNHVK